MFELYKCHVLTDAVDRILGAPNATGAALKSGYPSDLMLARGLCGTLQATGHNSSVESVRSSVRVPTPTTSTLSATACTQLADSSISGRRYRPMAPSTSSVAPFLGME